MSTPLLILEKAINDPAIAPYLVTMFNDKDTNNSNTSVHDSQVAIPLMQMTTERVKVLYDLADAAYDAPEIKKVSEMLGHVPIIDPNKRRGEEKELDPTSQIRYHVRTGVERANSEIKDNYGANHVRVKGHLKVLCHLMFGVLVLTVKKIFNYFA